MKNKDIKKNNLTRIFQRISINLLVSLMGISFVFGQTSDDRRLELVVPTGHTNTVTSVVFSPDEKTLASASLDNTVKLWDIASKKEIHTFIGHIEYVYSIAFSPDGKTIASGSLDETIKLWDVASGEEIHTLKGHTDQVYSVAFSPDGKTVASGSVDKTVKLWDAASGKELRTLSGHTRTVWSVSFSPDGITLASGSLDKSVKLWDVSNGKELRTFNGHTNDVRSVSFSPDSKTIATSSRDKTIKLWDVKSGKELQTFNGHTDAVRSVLFLKDGKTLVTGSRDKTIKLWDTMSGKELRTLKGHTGPINSISLSPDAKTIASGSQDKTVRIWNIENGKEVSSFKSSSSHIASTAFSPDGKTIASGSKYSTIKLWDVTNGNEVRTLSGHIGWVRSVAFSPDGKTIASGSDDKTAGLWSVKSGKKIHTFKGHTARVTSVMFSPDGKTLATKSDKTVRLWNIKSGRELRTLSSGNSRFESVIISPDGKTIATESSDGTVRLWNVKSGKELHTFNYDDAIELITFAEKGKLLILTESSSFSFNPELTVDVRDIAMGKVVERFDTSEQQIDVSKSDRLESISEQLKASGYKPAIKLSLYNNSNRKQISKDGKFQIKLGNYGRLNLHEIESDKLLASLIAIDKKDWVVISPDGRFDASKGALKSMYYSYGLRVIELKQYKDHYFESGFLSKLLGYNKEPLRSIVSLDRVVPSLPLNSTTLSPESQTPHLVVPTGHSQGIPSVAFSPDGLMLASGSGDSTVKLWNLATGQELRVFKGHYNHVMSVAFSPDGMTLASGSDDETIKLWDVISGRELKTLSGHEYGVTSVAFSADGKTIASGSEDETIKLWDIVLGQELRTLEGHSETVKSLAFSPDGMSLVSGSDDFTLKIWDLVTGKKPKTIEKHSNFVNAVAYSPDGKMIASGGGDKTIRLWNVETGEELKSFTLKFAVGDLSFSSDGKTLIYRGQKKIGHMDIESGKEIRMFLGNFQTLSLSSDGKTIASVLSDDTIKLWDLMTGTELKTLKGKVTSLSFSAKVSPNGKIMALFNDGQEIRLLNTGTGKMISLNRNSLGAHLISFSTDEKTLLSKDIFSERFNLWDVISGRELKLPKGFRPFSFSDKVFKISPFSPDGRTLAIENNDNTIRLWDISEGKENRKFKGHSRGVQSVAFSPSGNILASSSNDGTVKLWSVADGKELHTLKGHSYIPWLIAFSPDGKIIASGDTGGQVRLWDVASGRELRKFKSPGDRQYFSIGFSLDGKTLIWAGEYQNWKWDVVTGKGNKLEKLPDWTQRIAGTSIYARNGNLIDEERVGNDIVFRNAETDEEIASLIALHNNEWAVVTPKNLFDASPIAQDSMYFVLSSQKYGYETLDLEQLQSRYYIPGLLQKIIKGEPLPSVEPFFKKDMFPDVEFSQPKAGQKKLIVKLTNRGGGIGQVQILINGKEFVADARPKRFDPNTKKIKLKVSLKNAPFISGQKNKIEVVAQNASGSLSNRGTSDGFKYIDLRDQEINANAEINVLIDGTRSRLNLSKPFELELSAEQIHEFQVNLKAGEFMQAKVKQKGTEVLFTIHSKDGTKLMETVSPVFFEKHSFIAEKSGTYLIKIRHFQGEKKTKSGKYEISLITKGNPTDEDHLRVEADRLFAEGYSFFKEEQIQDNKKVNLEDKRSAEAEAKFLKVIPLWKELDEEFLEWASLGFLSASQLVSRKFQQGISTKKRQLELVRSLRSSKNPKFSDLRRKSFWKSQEALILNEISELYLKNGDYENSLKYAEKSVVFLKQEGQGNAAKIAEEIVQIINQKLKEAEFSKKQETISKTAQSERKAREALNANLPQIVVRTGHSQGIFHFAVSPDGRVLASRDLDGIVKLWDAANGQELRTFTLKSGSFGMVNMTSGGGLTFSSSGKILATVEGTNTIKLWDVTTGKELLSQSGASIKPAFSPDGKMVASGHLDEIKLWDIATGQKLKPSFSGHSSSINSFSFSPDGKILASGSRDKTIKLWDVESRKELKTLECPSIVLTVVFSPDGKTLASVNKDKTIRLWDITTGKILQTLKADTPFIESLAFSPDGKTLISGIEGKTPGSDGKIKLWNVATGHELKTLEGISLGVRAVFSNNGRTLVTSGLVGPELVDVETGKELRNFIMPTSIPIAIDSVAFSPAGKFLASAGTGGVFGEFFEIISFWGLSTGEGLKTLPLKGIGDRGRAFAFSPNGETLALPIFESSGITNIKLLNVATKREVSTIKDVKDLYLITSLTFSRDGKILASTKEKIIELWDVATGEVSDTLEGNFGWEVSPEFNEDGTILASVNKDRTTIKLWNLKTREVIITIKAHGHIKSIKFSPDGQTLVSTGNDRSRSLWDGNLEQRTIKLWDVVTGKKIDYEKLPDWAYLDKTTLELSNGKLIRADSKSNKIILYDVATEKEMATLANFNENDWVVVTPEGFFDGTPNGWKQLNWRFDNNTFNYSPIEPFFKEFYRPGLLQDIFAGNPIEPPKTDLSKIDIRQPSVLIAAIDEKPTDSAVEIAMKTVKVKVEITDNIEKGRRDFVEKSSGANDVRLFRNGSLVKLWTKEGISKDKTVSVFELTERDGCKQFAATKDTPRKAVCETEVEITAGENELSVYGFNHDNVKSNDDVAIVKGAESLKRKGKLQVLAIGVDKYQDSNYDLRFAVKDAVDFGVELRKQQAKLNNYDTPEVVQLTDAEATKQNILYALERFAKGEKAVQPKSVSVETEKKISSINKTQPEDVLIVYFAGHGTAAKDRFYLIPTDGFPTDAKDNKSRIEQLQKQSISDLELEAVFRDLDAGRLLFIIDACNSGQALEAEEKRRGPMNSRGLAQLAYEKGMYILTAAQSYQAALEVSRTPTGKSIEHGLLTYSLLEGLSTFKADNDDNKQITEREWFNFAVREVPKTQLEAMKKRNAEVKEGKVNKEGKRIAEIFFVENDKNKDVENRVLQTPRVFYRRETGDKPFIVATP